MLRHLILQLLFRVAMGQGLFDMFGLGGNAAADPFGFGGVGGTFDPYLSGGGGGGMMDPYMSAGGVADPFMGGGLGFQSVTPDPVAAQDARLTLAEEQMAEVLGESARNSPERRRVESLIQATGGQFTGDAANLNYLVQEYQMTTPGPMPTPEGEPQNGGAGGGPNNGGGRGQGGRRRNNRGRNKNFQGNGNNANIQNGPNQRNQGNVAGNRAPGGRVTGPSNRPRNNRPNNQQTYHDPYLQGNGPTMQPPYNDPYVQGNGAGNNPSFGQNNILNGGNGPNIHPPYNDPYAQGNNQGNQFGYEAVTPPTTVAYNDPYMSASGAGNQASFGNNQSPQPTNNFNAGNGPRNQQQYQEPNWQGNGVQNRQNGMGRSKAGPRALRPQPANNFNAGNGPNNQQQYQELYRQGNNAPNQQNQAFNQQANPSPGQAGSSNGGTLLPANQPGKAITKSKQGPIAVERLRRIETRISSVNEQIQQARMSNDIPKIENLEKQLTALNGVKMILSGGKAGTNSMETIQGIPQDQQSQQPLPTPTRTPFGPPKLNRNGNTGNANSPNNNFQETNVGGGQWDSNWNSNTPSPQRRPQRQQNGKVNIQPYESTTPPYNQQVDPYNQQPPYEPNAGHQMGPTELPMNQQMRGGGGQGRRQGGGGRRNRNNRRNAGMQQNGPTTAAPNLGDVRWIGNEKYIYMDADNAEAFQWVKASTIPKSQLDHLPQEGQGQGNANEAQTAPP